jgi:acyl-CoA dehydrogenase
MDFSIPKDMELIARLAKNIAEEYPPEYWREKDERHEFADEFWRSISEAGFTGAIIPEEYGGSGMGLQELMVIIENLCSNGTGLAGVWYLMLSEIFVSLPIVRYGTDEQKERYLPKLASGEYEGCLALTEPVAGTNTLNISTMAVKRGDTYIVNGSKIFISGIDRAELMVLVTRTTGVDEVSKKTLGLTLFLVELPNPAIKWSPLEKHGVNYSNTCEVSINNLVLKEDDILGPLEYGWYVLLDILNPERIGFAIGAIGTAELAIRKAVEYSINRRVFKDPIGSYQSLQHPLAESYASLQTAKLMAYKAAWLYDTLHKPPDNPRDGEEVMKKVGEYKEVGDAANMAKVVAIENAQKAVFWAMQIYGGYGYMRETDVERWWREINLLRLAPVTQQMALNYIAQHILGMPRSYR